QHLTRRPSPYLAPVVARLAASPPPAFIQLEHTISAYYRDRRRGTPCILSLHNLDSEVTAPGLRARFRARAMAVQERRAFPAVDRVLCVSDQDASAIAAVGGR